MKYWLKKCPRCRGDLREESDIAGTFITCLQCGHMLTESQEAALEAFGNIDHSSL
jgi:hypothetical protein